MQKLGHLWKKSEERGGRGNFFIKAPLTRKPEARSFQYVTKYGGAVALPGKGLPIRTADVRLKGYRPTEAKL